MRNSLPTPDASMIHGEAACYLEAISKSDGSIRRSKPKVDRNVPQTGRIAYVWRMVVFAISPIRQHQCMPVMAFCDLPKMDGETIGERAAARRAEEKRLDAIADEIIHAVPVKEWHGVARWRAVL